MTKREYTKAAQESNGLLDVHPKVHTIDFLEHREAWLSQLSGADRQSDLKAQLLLSRRSFIDGSVRPLRA